MSEICYRHIFRQVNRLRCGIGPARGLLSPQSFRQTARGSQHISEREHLVFGNIVA